MGGGGGAARHCPGFREEGPREDGVRVLDQHVDAQGLGACERQNGGWCPAYRTQQEKSQERSWNEMPQQEKGLLRASWRLHDQAHEPRREGVGAHDAAQQVRRAGFDVGVVDAEAAAHNTTHAWIRRDCPPRRKANGISRLDIAAEA